MKDKIIVDLKEFKDICNKYDLSLNQLCEIFDYFRTLKLVQFPNTK